MCRPFGLFEEMREREREREREIVLPLNVLKNLAHVQVIHFIDVGIQNSTTLQKWLSSDIYYLKRAIPVKSYELT